ELWRVADHDRIAWEIFQQRRILPATQRDHEQHVQVGTRFSNHPEGPEYSVLERPHRGIYQRPALVDALPWKVDRRSAFRIGPGSGVMEAGWQAPARQLQSGRQL